MKVTRLIIATLAFFAVSVPLSSQEYAIELIPDKKIIHVSELPLPGSMALVDYLLTLPELADRNADTFLERYDIKLDGKVISESRDAFLSSTFLRDVAKIEICFSPSDSHIKNGTSGSINVIPVSIQKGFSGDATVVMSALTGAMPSTNLRYSDGKKFEMRADLEMDIYGPTKLKSYDKYTDAYNQFGVDTFKVNYFGQMARVYAKWSPTEKDVLKFWVWQNYYTSNISTMSYRTKVEDMSEKMGDGWQFSSTERFSNVSNEKALTLVAIADYTRTLKNGEFKANADYHYTDKSGLRTDDLNTELKSVTNFKISDRLLKLSAILNTSTNSFRGQDNSMFYISPRLDIDYFGKHLSAKLIGRYKAYSRSYSTPDSKNYKAWYHDWSAEANLLWQIADHHALRFRLNRNVGVPSNESVYPEIVFDKNTLVWKKGNINLLGPVSNSANIDYITDWSNGPHHIIFNSSAEYDYNNRQIVNNILYDSEKKISYIYPVNGAYNNVASLTAMLNYSYGPFSMSFGGNVFYNFENLKVPNLKAGYFNIRFDPSVKLKNNWLIYASYLYNSKVYKEHATIGDCSVLTVRVTKTLKNWTLFLAIEDVFDGLTTDIEYLSRETVYTTYDPYLRSIVLGANFSF